MSKPKKPALGSGISDLIPTEDPVEPEASKNTAVPEEVKEYILGKPLYVKISDIVKNPDQPRKAFNNEEMTKLVNSIKEKGILEPLIVFKTAKGYQLVAGHRRLMAAEIAKLTTVPAIIREQVGEQSENLELALIENIIRQDLNPIEEAEAFEKLEKEYSKDVLSIAKLVCKDSSTIKNSIRLLKLPDPVKQDIRETRLSAGHGKALLTLDSDHELLMKARNEILSKALTVRQAEALTKKLSKPRKKKISRDKEEQKAYFESLAKTISESLNGLKVNITSQGRNKKIIINCNTVDNIEFILKKLNITVQS
jgi:ParB family chromosome partitioning protein